MSVRLPDGSRDRADDGFLTLLGEIPTLVRNLVTAEVNAAKSWVGRTAKDYGIGVGWLVAALFLLFWLIPVLLTAAVAGIAVALPVWLSALIVAAALLLIVAVLVLLGIQRFKRASARPNPVDAVKQDVSIVQEASHGGH